MNEKINNIKDAIDIALSIDLIDADDANYLEDLTDRNSSVIAQELNNHGYTINEFFDAFNSDNKNSNAAEAVAWATIQEVREREDMNPDDWNECFGQFIASILAAIYCYSIEKLSIEQDLSVIPSIQASI